jgi:serine protease Do
MLKFIPALVGLCACASLPAATVQLSGKAAITGKILAEKPETVVVDIGYTVLTVPRTEIVTIVEDASGPESANVSTNAAKTVALPPAFYSNASGAAKDRSMRELSAQLGEAVVQVRTPAGLGSGFIINEDGFLVTNFHVVEGETKLSVEVYLAQGGSLDRKVYKQIRIVALNKFADLALLKIEDSDAPKFSRVELGGADALSVGERVFAIGSPMGLERTVTEGIVSTTTRQYQGDLFIQTTAQINPGNSGGPLFNLRGEVVGVTNMKLTYGEGLGFAIPIERVKYFLDHRDAYAYENDSPGNAFHYLPPPSRMSQPPTP